MLTHPDALPNEDQLRMKIAVAHCPELEALAGHIRSFGQILTRREGHLTQEWIAAVHADDLPGLHSFADGLERDLAAVVAGLSTPWNSGVVEATSTESRCCRVAGGITAPGSHGTVRNNLSLYGSCCPGHQTTGTLGTQAQ
ncbi:hypothetical protein Slala03_80540 [Streptomyces lavendulae subsp. lavendulae]|nr:hypothetical protein Slala03_80540 [Streptomyces lavendulae subsp. lavendulae]